MKKQFYPRTTSAGLLRRVSLFSALAGVVILVFLLLRFVFPSAFFFLATPLWQVGNTLTTSVDSLWGGLASKQALMKEAATLQSERDALFQENQTLTAKLSDVQKTLQGGEVKDITVVAGVIARPPVSPYDTLIISLPISYSPNNGTLVVGTGGAPLGTIANVSGTTANVTLFSSSGRSTEGWIGESRTPITLIGSGTGSFEATLSGAATVTEGDPVYIPGPGALYLGKIIKVQKDDTTQKLHLFIRSAVNPFTISSVGIRTP